MPPRAPFNRDNKLNRAPPPLSSSSSSSSEVHKRDNISSVDSRRVSQKIKYKIAAICTAERITTHITLQTGIVMYELSLCWSRANGKLPSIYIGNIRKRLNGFRHPQQPSIHPSIQPADHMPFRHPFPPAENVLCAEKRSEKSHHLSFDVLCRPPVAASHHMHPTTYPTPHHPIPTPLVHPWQKRCAKPQHTLTHPRWNVCLCPSRVISGDKGD